jgi:hypothetical protein
MRISQPVNALNPWVNVISTTQLAQADSWRTYAVRKTLYRVVAKKNLDDALTSDLKLTCPDGCEKTGADIIYRAAPSAYMEQKKQRAICIELERQTTAAPLQFARRHFESLEEMNDSLMLFSRGKGAQGKDLYQRCGSNCSPRYTFHIRDLQHSGLSVAAEVVCGLARDRSNKHYQLSTSRQVRCENVPQRTKLSK